MWALVQEVCNNELDKNMIMRHNPGNRGVLWGGIKKSSQGREEPTSVYRVKRSRTKNIVAS
jgi:hypothetical protein